MKCKAHKGLKQLLIFCVDGDRCDHDIILQPAPHVHVTYGNTFFVCGGQ